MHVQPRKSKDMRLRISLLDTASLEQGVVLATASRPKTNTGFANQLTTTKGTPLHLRGVIVVLGRVEVDVRRMTHD